ncbi:hypothetical protein NQ317_016479 [Molorchus minor]|uniref:Uncharacterized protein n=1 Tax=Molorchus minor TaxID=1323400 RepID=A0ABQ9JB92_9CUCU|nr:hypothetical protein NQ317_016479 [Molorchus minor]
MVDWVRKTGNTKQHSNTNESHMGSQYGDFRPSSIYGNMLLPIVFLFEAPSALLTEPLPSAERAQYFYFLTT